MKKSPDKLYLRKDSYDNVKGQYLGVCTIRKNRDDIEYIDIEQHYKSIKDVTDECEKHKARRGELLEPLRQAWKFASGMDEINDAVNELAEKLGWDKE